MQEKIVLGYSVALAYINVEERKILLLNNFINSETVNSEEEALKYAIKDNEKDIKNLRLVTHSVLTLKTTPEVSTGSTSDVLIEKALEEYAQNVYQKDTPIIVSNKSYSVNQILEEVRQRTPFGIQFMQDIISLTIDLISRNKRKLPSDESNL